MNPAVLDALRNEGLLTERQHSLLTGIYSQKLFSLYYELRTMLYLGVLLFTTGVGILVYLNIETIGHQVIILALMVLTGLCFWYVARRRAPYSNGQVQSPGVLFDYILLLGCLLFTTVVGYLQFQYGLFGEHWEFGALLPAVACLASSYLFDHRGVLSIGITGIGSWLGLTVTPLGLLESGQFHEGSLIETGLFFGLGLVAVALLLDRRGVKKHFTFTYLSFGANIFFIACLYGLFLTHGDAGYLLATIAGVVGGILYARREQSFFFLLISSVFGYIGVTYMLGQFIEDPLVWMLYFLVSCGGVIYFLFHYKRFLSR